MGEFSFNNLLKQAKEFAINIKPLVGYFKGALGPGGTEKDFIYIWRPMSARET